MKINTHHDNIQYYLGVDIAKYNHQAFLCDHTGKSLGEPLSFANTYSGYQQFKAFLKKHTARTATARTASVANNSVNSLYNIHVGMEATGPYWLSLYGFLSDLGAKVTVLNPLQVRAYRNDNIRGNKTDRIDAALISKIIRFGDYNPSAIANEQDLGSRHLTRMRTNMVRQIAGLKKKVVATYDQVFPEYKKLFENMFSATSKAVLEQSILPENLAKLPTSKLSKLIKQASRGRLGEQLAETKANQIKQTAAQSIGITIALDAFELSITMLLEQIKHLEKQVKKLDKEIKKYREKQADNLTSIPGIGDILAATIRAEIGNFERFKDLKDGAEKLVALAGIDPKLRESGKLVGKVKMSKRGSPYLRHAVRQASFVAVHVSKDPMFTAIQEKQLSRGKHFEVALSHVSNKMMHVIFSILRSGKDYKPYATAKIKIITKT